MDTQFASVADLEEKQVSFERLSENAYAYTTEGDPNTGIIIGDDADANCACHLKRVYLKEAVYEDSCV